MELTERQQQAQRQLEAMNDSLKATLRNSPGYVLGLMEAGDPQPGSQNHRSASGTAPRSNGRHGWEAVVAKLNAELRGDDDE